MDAAERPALTSERGFQPRVRACVAHRPETNEVAAIRGLSAHNEA